MELSWLLSIEEVIIFEMNFAMKESIQASGVTKRVKILRWKDYIQLREKSDSKLIVHLILHFWLPLEHDKEYYSCFFTAEYLFIIWRIIVLWGV